MPITIKTDTLSALLAKNKTKTIASILPKKDIKNILKGLLIKNGKEAVVNIKKPTKSLAHDEIPRT